LIIIVLKDICIKNQIYIVINIKSKLIEMKFNINKIRLVVLAVTFLLVNYSYSQNIIPNSGFDDLHSGKHSIYPWTKINTIDFFLETKSGKTSTSNIQDKNFIPRKARSSPAYIGMRVKSDYREFLQIKLPAPMIANHKYVFEMHVINSSYSSHYLRSIGVAFSERKYAYASDIIVMRFRPQIEFCEKNGIKSETDDWRQLTATYVAVGGEKFLTIGNFSEKKKDRLSGKKFSVFPKPQKEAYIYIDDISLIDLDAAPNAIINAVVDTDTSYINGNYIARAVEDDGIAVLKNIFFEFNSSKLKAESFEELHLLLEYMYEYPLIEIEIIGHTDIKGSQHYNQKLSTLRAKAVYDFLVSNKISSSRLSYSGKGASKPVADNETEDGRMLNRRVEVVLKK